MCMLLPSGETQNYISAQKERSRLWDRSHGGIHPQDSLADQHARLAGSATGTSPGGRFLDRELFNGPGHPDDSRGPI